MEQLLVFGHQVKDINFNLATRTQILGKSAINFNKKSGQRILKCTLLLNKSKYCEKISMIVIYNKFEKDL